ncbi:MAG: efflux RND transporter periplasmic adaptor subunit [Acidobacteriota bacterium]
MLSTRFCPVLTAVLAAMLYVSCGEEETAPKPVIRPVRYQQVFSTGSSRERTFSGTSRAALESRLSFKVAGTVRRVPVKVGDAVKVGTLIAELDPKDYQLQVQEAEAALKSAEAQARNANSALSRVRALYENRNASRNDLDAAQAAAASARAQVSSFQKRVELARSQLSYTRLTSPVEGSIAAMNADENENVSPGQPVALLTSGSKLEILVAIPEILIAQIREGNETTVSFDAIPDRPFSGTVTEVGVSSTGMATTFPVTVRLTHDDPDCRPGMAAEVIFRFGSRGGRERILVPSVAAGEDRQGRFVFVLERAEEGFGIARRRPVRVGDVTEEGIEILEGLQDGDLVVTAGVSRVQDGQQVRMLASQ